MIQNRIKETRARREVTQKQLEQLSGVPYHTITKIEQGAVVPKVDTALSIAGALNTTVENLFQVRKSEPERTELS